MLWWAQEGLLAVETEAFPLGRRCHLPGVQTRVPPDVMPLKHERVYVVGCLKGRPAERHLRYSCLGLLLHVRPFLQGLTLDPGNCEFLFA